MNYRSVCRAADVALIAEVVGLHAAIYCWPEPRASYHAVALAKDAQALAAPALILGFVILGPERVWIRASGLVMMGGLWLWELVISGQIDATTAAPLIVVSALAYSVLRMTGFRLAATSDTVEPPRGGQYSLRQLMIAMTAIAVAIGVLEWLRPALNGGAAGDLSGSMISSIMFALQLRQAVLGVALTGTAMGAIWIVLAPGSMKVRAIGGLVAVVGGVLYLAHLTEPGMETLGQEISDLLPGFLAVGALCAATALAARVNGYQLKRSPRGAKREDDEASIATLEHQPGVGQMF